METFFTALGSAVLGGIISPIVLAFLQHYFIWRTQKTAETRKQVFEETINGIAMFEADMLNAAGGTPATRPETTDQVQKALALVEAFYSRDAFDALTAYLKRDLSKGTNANLNQLRATAIKKLAADLGLSI